MKRVGQFSIVHATPKKRKLDRFSIRRRAEALAYADTRTLKRALYGGNADRSRRSKHSAEAVRGHELCNSLPE